MCVDSSIVLALTVTSKGIASGSKGNGGKSIELEEELDDDIDDELEDGAEEELEEGRSISSHVGGFPVSCVVRTSPVDPILRDTQLDPSQYCKSPLVAKGDSIYLTTLLFLFIDFSCFVRTQTNFHHFDKYDPKASLD
jgi:hypothetical protein